MRRSARIASARRAASDRRRRGRSMADDKKSKPAGKAPAKAPKPEKGGKGAKGGGAESVRGKVTEGRPTGPKEKPRLARHYLDSVRAALVEKFGYKNPMQVPRMLKIVLNMGVGDALTDAKLLDAAMNEMGQIAGQRPAVRRARKSISNFK